MTPPSIGAVMNFHRHCRRPSWHSVGISILYIYACHHAFPPSQPWLRVEHRSVDIPSATTTHRSITRKHQPITRILLQRHSWLRSCNM
ncbi:hypothetical protein VTK73DRAFT_5933 [Phialemonium thermophilum]|uniref:Uncharacterized protein n=1 Tax=Phialemonium thermophilum TaxID=223376 RepID=A0ABR3V1H6_9PEZI